jgi:hypothetical protein
MGAGACFSDTLLQAASTARTTVPSTRCANTGAWDDNAWAAGRAAPGNELRPIMGLILLEALAALGVLLFLVWWTMFAGRKGGEPPPRERQDGDQADGGRKN